MEKYGSKIKYLDLQFPMSTSNLVERFFSLPHLILPDQHQSMSPIVFEAMLLEEQNDREFWSVIDVAQAMRNTPSEKNELV
jgi:hypothetical protein